MMRKHILVVDDDAAFLSMLKMRLKSIGHTVDTAETGWDGLTKLEHADYDVLLLDYMTPGITGMTVLQHIKTRHPSVPVVMMTGQSSSQTSVGLMNSEEGQETIHRRPVWLTNTVEKIDRVLTDVREQIENLRRDRVNLGMVRVRLSCRRDCTS